MSLKNLVVLKNQCYSNWTVLSKLDCIQKMARGLKFFCLQSRGILLSMQQQGTDQLRSLFSNMKNIGFLMSQLMLNFIMSLSLKI